MSWKRDLAEAFVWLASRFAPTDTTCSTDPDTIFVLRNNDLGDVLVITPLFQALRDRFPKAKIVAGIGDWAKPLLEGNPYISEVLPVNAPWHNQVIQDQGLLASFSYILYSDESQNLSSRHFDVGIDVVGSHFGSLLFLKAGIPYRIGVQGFAGGHSGTHGFVNYNHYEHVGRSAVRFAEILSAQNPENIPAIRPQIFLSADEKDEAEHRWQGKGKRIVLGPGGGFITKCWPANYFKQLLAALAKEDVEIIIVGSEKDIALAEELSSAAGTNLAGQLSLRQTLALVATSHLVICNSSMLMHAAAAFEIPQVVPLGEYFVDSKQHMAQWGYGGLTTMLGMNEDRKDIYRPSEVLSQVQLELG